MESKELGTTHIDFVIRDKTELKKLLSVASIFKRYTAIKLELHQIDNQVQQQWQTEINRYYGACGCGEGKFFVFLGFLTFMGIAYLNDNLVMSWANCGKAFLFCMAGAVFGKLFGLYRAHLKLKKLIKSILLTMNYFF